MRSPREEGQLLPCCHGKHRQHLESRWKDKAPEKVSDLPKVTQLFALKPKLGSYVRSQG